MLQSILFLATIGLGYVYAFITGFSDASNSVASAIGSRAITPKTALQIASIMEFFGALTGTAVAITITTGIISLSDVRVSTVFAALAGTLIWSVITYFFGIPVSETHGLIGAILGAGIAVGGFEVVLIGKLQYTFIAIFLSPIFGLFFGYIVMKLVRFFFAGSDQKSSRRLFSRLQYITTAFVSFSHGHNDAQKPMGIIAMVIAVQFGIKNPTVPFWVIVSVAVVEAIGVAFGGVRILKTLGLKLAKLRIDQAFVSQVTASGILELASFFGIPTSTTQTITSTLVGTAFGQRKSSVKWGLVQHIFLSWIFTLPATLLISFGFMKGLMFFGL
jgi:inorganic phosphate transporter, PiT family